MYCNIKIFEYIYMELKKLKNSDFTEEAEILKILGHPIRLKIVCGLIEQSLCVNDIGDCLGEPQPKISQHLALLRAKGIVKAEREGVNIKYRVVHPLVIKIIKLVEREKLKE
ncbi:metalloregulator ArsR/SmtB family transcription factor [Candidatus Kryptobacter tengchongensis]|uniref:ArsR/SmtB family transcription factor n=1 Tax=Kryptobacter tengchongensis TaxID=1643429 RepID=UPI002A4E2259|nr:metalloregulator ArsR/SmtB family transcription factor [Candidatus Kryptobacter tengchongensis]